MLNRFKQGFIISLIMCCVGFVQAQSAVTVPDVSGLSVPEAAAELNRAGLQVGTITATGWSADSVAPQNTVAEQSIPAGQTADFGSAVDLTVLRTANIALIYDDNDLTLVNLTGQFIDLTGLMFTAVEGGTATFSAGRWSAGLRGNQCMQIWSVNRNGPKDLPDCEFIQNWLTTNNTAEHFWTRNSGVTDFAVLENGVERGRCVAAPQGMQDTPFRCEVFISAADSGEDVAPFIYLAYTPDAIAIINRTPDQWMPTDQTMFYNFNPQIQVAGASLIFGDPALFNEAPVIGDVSLLAPNQCIMLTNSTANVTNPPQACDLISQKSLDPSVIFWTAQFEIESVTDGRRRACPAADATKTTLCIVPR